MGAPSRFLMSVNGAIASMEHMPVEFCLESRVNHVGEDDFKVLDMNSK